MFASRLALTAAAAGRALSQGERVIFDKLTAALAPGKLTVDDVSGGCGAMYRVIVHSAQFAGKSKVQQHRLVNEILKEDIKQMHGIQLQTAAL